MPEEMDAHQDALADERMSKAQEWLSAGIKHFAPFPDNAERIEFSFRVFYDDGSVVEIHGKGGKESV
jgi:hypothetical protein